MIVVFTEIIFSKLKLLKNYLRYHQYNKNDWMVLPVNKLSIRFEKVKSIVNKFNKNLIVMFFSKIGLIFNDEVVYRIN
jgi:hypothetical protein